jgi:hypothetical protein
MEPCSIKVDTNTKVKIDGKDAIAVVPSTSTKVEAIANSVKAHSRSYQIVANDVYTIKRNSELEPWFSDQINNMIDGSDLASDVGDLDNRFTNFQDGVTLEIGYLKDKDNELAYNMSVLKTSNDMNTVAIQTLDTVKVSADEARAISNTTIGSWLNSGESAAWFDSRVSTVSNVAYSAAKSASTLTASINSQQDQLRAITSDIDVLQSQVDGKVETWFSTDNPVFADGTINPDIEPYKSWLAANDVARHSGDTYVYFEYDVNGNKRLLVTFRFGYDVDTQGAEWYVFEDDLASEAYQRALQAQDTADGKITTYYQTYPPTVNDNPELDLGDLWLDSDDGNKMYRFQGNPLAWTLVEDKRITASVTRLDEATVDVNGEARAKSSLSVEANGVIAGYVAESDGSTASFNIYADKFTVSDGTTSNQPLRIENGQTYFNGKVEFSSLEGATDLVRDYQLKDGTTVISGSNILTGYIKANRIDANYLSAISANLGTVTAGIMYNSGGNASNYTMKIDLNHGEIHIK